MYREVTGSDHSDGSGNLPVHSSVPGGYRCFSFAVSSVASIAVEAVTSLSSVTSSLTLRSSLQMGTVCPVLLMAVMFVDMIHS